MLTPPEGVWCHIQGQCTEHMVAAGHSVGCLPETKPADIQVWDISWKILGGTGCSCKQSHLTTVKPQCIQGLCFKLIAFRKAWITYDDTALTPMYRSLKSVHHTSHIFNICRYCSFIPLLTNVPTLESDKLYLILSAY